MEATVDPINSEESTPMDTTRSQNNVTPLSESIRSKETQDRFKKITVDSHCSKKFGVLIAERTLKECKCKILTIEECPMLCEVVVEFEKANFAKSLTESGIFILILSVAGTASENEGEFQRGIIPMLTKPMILQINYNDEKNIYFKEPDQAIRKLELKENRNWKQSIISDIDFEAICNLLNFGTNYGKFNLNLIDTEVAIEKIIRGLRLVDWTIKHCNLLCLMFLKLFEPNFEVLGGKLAKAKCKTANFLIKYVLNIDSLNKYACKTVAHKAWYNYKKTIELTPCDNNLIGKHLDILVEIYQNDASFPEFTSLVEFISTLNSNNKLKMLVSDRKNFHDAIKHNKIKDVEKFVQENDLKIAYDTSNNCALTTALKSKNFKIYSFLHSKSFSCGIDIQHDQYFQKLNIEDREQMRESNHEYFLTNENHHILYLALNSRLAFGNDLKSFSQIQRFYEMLNNIKELRPILKIVASHSEIKFVFDFDNISIKEIDPTAHELVHGRTTLKKPVCISIGAKREIYEVLGTLAHELTHFALLLVYRNNCKPFSTLTKEKKKKFEEVVTFFEKKCSQTIAVNNIIKLAFQKDYSHELKVVELIVRPSHLIAMHLHEPEILEKIRKENLSLFEFFESETLPDLEREAALIKPRRDIKDANTSFGVYAKATELDWLSDEGMNKILKSDDFPKIIRGSIFFRTPITDLLLESIVKIYLNANMNEVISNNIFVNLEQMFIKKYFDILNQLTESKVQPTIFIIENYDKMDNREFKAEDLADMFGNLKIVFISSIENSNFRKCFPDGVSGESVVNFKWDDLNNNSKSRIQDWKVVFQNSEAVFKEIVPETVLQQCESSIEFILQPSKLILQNFNESLPKLPRVLIEQTFKSNDDSEDESDDEKEGKSEEGNSSKELKIEDICEILKGQKKVLIADSAGMGKSTSAVKVAIKLKLLNPLSWVVFIDLKDHTKAFVRDNSPRAVTIDANYFSQELLKLGNEFEQKLFESFFEKNKVIFVIDGFDEISPNFKQFVMEILKTIQNSDNQLLVTTRPHLVEELKKELDASAFKLMPFTGKDQIKFLTEYWQHKSNIQESKIEDFLKKFKLTLSSDFYSTPIHIFMLAEVLECKDLENLEDIKMNDFSLYKEFFDMKLDVWLSKGQLAKNESNKIHGSSANLRQIFQKLALKQLFDADELEELNLSEITEEFTNEMVLRVGIVSFSARGTLQFTHQTFAEYFAADFVLKGVTDKTPQNADLNLFFKFLTNRNLETVRKFMNKGLCCFAEKMNIEALSRHFEKILSSILVDGISAILSGIVFENHANLVAFVLEDLILDTNAKKELVKNILFQIIIITESFEVIWRCFKSFEKSVQKNILFARIGRRTVLYQAVISDHLNKEEHGLIQFLEIATSSLDEKYFFKLILGEEGDDFQFYNHALNYKGALRLIWEAAKPKLGTENLKNLATGKNEMSGNTILLSFYDEDVDGAGFDLFLDELLWWLEDIKNLLTTNELSELIATKNYSGQSLFSKIVKYIKLEDFQKLWKFIPENVDEAGQRELIFHKDSSEMNLIELSFENIDERVSFFVYEIAESLLSKDGKDIIGYYKEQCRLVDFIFDTAIWSDSLFEKISAKLEKDELRKILLSKNTEGNNIFHCLVKLRNKDDKLRLWNFVIGRINDVEAVKNLLFETGGWRGTNVFHLAVSSGEYIIFDILDWCKVNFSHEDFKNIFLERNDSRGFTLLHECCKPWGRDLVKKGFAFVEENFSSEDQELIFSLRDNEGRTPQMVREDPFPLN